MTNGTDPLKKSGLDIASLRIDPSANLVPVQRIIAVVPIRKPKKTEFVRVNPDMAARMAFYVCADPDDKDATFIIHPDVMAAAGAGVPARPVMLVMAVTRDGAPFLWPVPLPTGDGRTNAWHSSAAIGAEHARAEWTRLSSNMAAGQYDIHKASPGVIPAPVWEDLPSFDELLSIALSGRVVSDLDHVFLKKLRGEV